MKPHLESLLTTLQSRITTWEAYRDECIRIGTRHGVIDAECDMREFEAQATLIQQLLARPELAAQAERHVPPMYVWKTMPKYKPQRDYMDCIVVWRTPIACTQRHAKWHQAFPADEGYWQVHGAEYNANDVERWMEIPE